MPPSPVERFTITGAFRFARQAYLADAFRLSGLSVAMVLLWALLEVLVALSQRWFGTAVNIGLHLAYFWAACLPEATLIQVSLDKLEGREPRFRETLRDIRLSRDFFVAKMLFALVVAAGTVLALIPGIYLAIRFQFVEYFVVERRCGPLEAFRLSSRATRGVRWRIFGFEALLLLVHGIGACFLGLGTLATIPFAALASACLFRALCRRPTGSENTPELPREA